MILIIQGNYLGRYGPTKTMMKKGKEIKTKIFLDVMALLATRFQEKKLLRQTHQ